MATAPKFLFIGEVSGVAPLVAASANAGYTTYVLVGMSSLFSPSDLYMIRQFNRWGARIAQGKLSDHQSLVKAIQQADVVISVELAEADNNKIISAINQAGDDKGFITLRPANEANRAYPSYSPPNDQVPPSNFNPYHRPPPNFNPYHPPPPNFNPYHPPPPNFNPYPQPLAASAYQLQHNISLAERLLRAIPLFGLAFEVFQYIEG